ncbi:hypothetical protein FACS189449_00070 [Alphaproteobacteria bacterium]|nr:hypothetical protein FACS189449_00070 [Alphaproteobacteria bacterium]
MCTIFLLAGAFGEVTKSIGAVDSLINLGTSFLSPSFLLVGIFLITAFLSTSIGGAIGTIAAIGPIAAELSSMAHGLPAPLAMGTVVGGAMLGNNLSVVSDATIAAVSSQGADMHKRLKINLRIASIASVVTVILLWFSATITVGDIKGGDYSLLLIAPYIVLIILAYGGVNVFASLLLSTALAGTIACFMKGDYGVIAFSNDLNAGFGNVNTIMLLSLMIGGMSGLVGEEAMTNVTGAISTWMSKKKKVKSSLPQLVIAGLVSMATALLSNNVVAVIFCSKVAKGIAKENGISSHYTATILEVFACGVKGVLPYGAQVLLAASLANISPLSVIPYVYYCYALIVSGIIFMLLVDKKAAVLN